MHCTQSKHNSKNITLHDNDGLITCQLRTLYKQYFTFYYYYYFFSARSFCWITMCIYKRIFTMQICPIADVSLYLKSRHTRQEMKVPTHSNTQFIAFAVRMQDHDKKYCYFDTPTSKCRRIESKIRIGKEIIRTRTRWRTKFFTEHASRSCWYRQLQTLDLHRKHLDARRDDGRDQRNTGQGRFLSGADV